MFDNSNANDTRMSELVSKICKLASCADDRSNASEREESLHETLRQAYQIEEYLNQQKERIAYLERLAMTDSLTGLLNRRGFKAELQRVLASARRFNETGVLAYIDLDDFKKVNDSFGHACGDEVLCHVARIMENMTRGMDYIARLGGDEFAILLVRSSWEDGQKRIEKIAAELNSTILHWQGRQIALKASVGIEAYQAQSSIGELLNSADTAMYAIKQHKTDQKREECLLNAAE